MSPLDEVVFCAFIALALTGLGLLALERWHR
jgi:hypothetical protein